MKHKEQDFGIVESMLAETPQETDRDPEETSQPDSQPDVDTEALRQIARKHQARMKRDTQEILALREQQPDIGEDDPWFLNQEEWSEVADPRLGLVRKVMVGNEVRLPRPARVLNPDSSQAQYIKLFRTEYGREILAEFWKLDLSKPKQRKVFEEKLEQHLKELYQQGISEQLAKKANQALEKLTKRSNQ